MNGSRDEVIFLTRRGLTDIVNGMEVAAMAELQQENERFIEQQLASGAYPSREAVIDDAIQCLKWYEKVLEKVDTGLKDVDEGRMEEFTEEELHTFFDRVIDEASGSRHGSEN
jgi:predicted transcriptional regulator